MFKKLVHRYIHLWDEYDKASKYFVKPVLKFYFGRWSKFNGLPVWRTGPTINVLGKEITLPLWLSFYYFNRDIIWKTKWDECRYEFPGQFCIVAFGLCFVMWLDAPKTYVDCLVQKRTNPYSSPDAYWEVILEYNYRFKSFPEEERFRKVIEDSVCSISINTKYDREKKDHLWEEIHKCDFNSKEYSTLMKKLDFYGQNVCWLCCRPEYLTEEGKKIWNDVNEILSSSKKYTKSYWIGC